VAIGRDLLDLHASNTSEVVAAAVVQDGHKVGRSMHLTHAMSTIGNARGPGVVP
jgi:hypothetical protein